MRAIALLTLFWHFYQLCFLLMHCLYSVANLLSTNMPRIATLLPRPTLSHTRPSAVLLTPPSTPMLLAGTSTLPHTNQNSPPCLVTHPRPTPPTALSQQSFPPTPRTSPLPPMKMTWTTSLAVMRMKRKTQRLSRSAKLVLLNTRRRRRARSSLLPSHWLH